MAGHKGASGRPRLPISKMTTYQGKHRVKHLRHWNPQYDKVINKPTFIGSEAWVTEADSHWDELVTQLIDQGVVQSTDRPVLIAMCEFWADYRVSQSFSQKSKAFQLWFRIASRMGLSPSDRMGLAAAPKTGDRAEVLRAIRPA